MAIHDEDRKLENKAAVTPLLHSVHNACTKLGVGRNTIYNNVNDGDLELVKIGRRSFITDRSINAYLDKICAEAADRGALHDASAEQAIKAKARKRQSAV
jgi:excisionase family DNA binding protein